MFSSPSVHWVSLKRLHWMDGESLAPRLPPEFASLILNSSAAKPLTKGSQMHVTLTFLVSFLCFCLQFMANASDAHKDCRTLSLSRGRGRGEGIFLLSEVHPSAYGNKTPPDSTEPES